MDQRTGNTDLTTRQGPLVPGEELESRMPAKVLPPVGELKKLSDRGMSHAQIVEHIAQTTGQRVTRAAVSVALNRAGFSKEVVRYDDVIPWTVRAVHNKHYAVRMLRLAARQQRNLPLTESEERKLNSWLELLRSEDAVVHYDPDTDDGFFYVRRRKGDGKLIRKVNNN